MAPRVNGPLRGFLAHHTRIDRSHLAVNTGAAVTSSYTQAGPRPGDSVPDDDLTSYLVRAHNAQDVDLDARVVRPGLPRIDGAAVLYRETGEADESFRGWNEPNLVTLYKPIDWTSTEDWLDVDAVVVPSTQQVVAIAADTDATSPEPVSTWTWTPATRTWSTREEVQSTTVRTLCCIVCLSRSERLIAYQCDPADGNVRAHYSDGAGLSWDQYDRDGGVLTGVNIDSSVDRIRVVEDRNGALLMVATDTATGDWWMFRSDDSGANFEELDDGTGLGNRHSMVRMGDGRIVFVYREQATTDLKSIVLEDAYDTLSTKVGTAIDSTNNTDFGEVTCDADGVLYVVISAQSSDVMKVARSVDNAESWTVYAHGLRQVGSVASPTTHRVHVLGLAPSGGELVALVRTLHTGTSPATDGSLLSLVLGGWMNVEARTLSQAALRTNRRSFGSTSPSVNATGVFLPGETLANQGWTASGTAETLLNGYHRFNPAAAVSSAIEAFVRTTGALSVLVEAQLVSGSGARIVSRREDGVLSYAISIRFTSVTTFEVWDDEAAGGAGAIVGSAVTFAGVAAVSQYLIVWADDPTISSNATVFYRLANSSTFTKGPQTAVTGRNLGAVTGNDFVSVGAPSAATCDARYGLIAWGAWAALTGIVADAGFTNDQVWGKALTTRPYPVRDQGSSDVLHLTATGGSSKYAEGFTLTASYDHGIREVFPQESPSPSATWRSTSTAEQIVVWDMELDSRLGPTWALGLALIGANFRTAVLEGRADAAGAWTAIGTWDAAVAVDVPYARFGDLIVPGTSGTQAAAWWSAGWLTGGHVILDTGGAPSGHRIRAQHGGGWTPGVTARAGLLLDGIGGAEASTGLCTIMAPAGVLVAHDTTTAIRRIRVRVPATQVVPDSYYEIGSLVLGSLIVPGRQWSRGWSWRYTPRVVLEEDERGTTWPEQRGPTRAELTVAWQDGYDEAQLRRGPDAPYVSAAAGKPGLAGDRDVLGPLIQLLEETEGGQLPVVAIADVPAATGMVLDPRLWLYGLCTTPRQWNNVQGLEGRDEVGRVESITIVQQV